MAQIIKHRRGSLESVSGATKRAGELLVVTGSSGITATNGDTILLVGIDGSTVTPSNKFLQGSSVPDLTGASYDTSVDGIPFYDTSAEKLYILNKGGNVEVKATANTGGTNIVSSSADTDNVDITIEGGVVSANLKGNVYSGSSQVASDFTTDNTSLDLGSGTFTTTGTLDVGDTTVDSLDSSGFISASSIDISGNANIGGNLTLGGNITIGDATTDTIAITADLTSDLRPDVDNDVDLGSASNRFAQIHGVNIYGAINATNNIVSGSSDTDNVDITIASGVISANLKGGVISGSEQIGALGVNIVSSSADTDNVDITIASGVISANLKGGVISGSDQLLNVATDFGTGRVSGDNFGDADGGSTFTGSFQGDGSGLTGLATNLIISSSDDGTNDSLDLLNDSLVFAGTANELEVSVDSATNTVQFGLPDNVTVGGNLTISGDLQVEGTTTTIDSTTVQIGDNIIELNGTGAANGGMYVSDPTAPNTDTGSMIWDSTNDYWKAGTKDNEVKVLLADGDSVISGSSQVTITDTEGFSTFSSSLKNTDDTQDGRLDNLESFTSSQETKNTTLETVTSSLDTRLDALETFSSSADNVFLEINGDDVVSGSGQVVDLLDSQDVNLGGISGSSLDITGNAKIDGNITIGGNLTLGDAATDTISFAGDVNSDILPSSDDSFDLGSSTDRFAEVHATDLFGAVNATNNVVSGSSDTDNVDITIASGVISANLKGGVVSGSSQVTDLLLNTATDFGTGRVSGDNFGDEAGTSTFTGSFSGDGSNLTGLVTDLRITGSTGDDVVSLLEDGLTFAGGTGVTAAVTDNTVTFNVQDGSTSQKGIVSFVADDFSVSSGNVSIKDGGVRAVNFNADVAGTGISLNGVDNTIEVDYGSTSGTAVEGNTSLTVQGTTNEIEVSGGSVTLGSGGTVTVGLPDDVTIGNDLTVTNDATISNNLTVVGNLSVQGTTTTVDSTTVQIGDNILELNIGGAQSTAGLQVTDATAPNTVSGSLLWDGTNDYWMGGALGSEKEFARFNADPTSGSVQVIGADGLLVDSTITDDGTDVSITGDFTINGLSTANSFVYADGDKTLQAVQPSNAGDLIQWNGSSFVASNEIDGGTF